MLSIKLDAVPLPKFVEPRHNDDWVAAGKNDGYFDFLLELYNTANIHNSILANKMKYVFGSGFTFKADEGVTNDVIVEVAKARKANEDGEDYDDVLRKVTSDYELYNGLAIEVIYNATYDKVVEMRHVDFSKVRTNADESRYAYADKWCTDSGYRMQKAKIRHDDNNYMEYAPFNPENARADSGVQLLYYKEYRPSIEYYPLPDYIGVTQYILAEKKISEYHVNNIDNNFWNNFMVNFKDGEPTEDEKRELTNMFKSRHVGTDAKEKVLFTFTDPGIEVPQVVQFDDNTSADVFEYLSDEIQKQLFIGHGVTSPMLFGVRTEGQLGGRTELIEANELYQNRYVAYRQFQLEKQFNKILDVNDMPATLKIQPIQPISYDVFASPEMVAVLTIKEKRRLLAEKYGIELDNTDVEVTE